MLYIFVVLEQEFLGTNMSTIVIILMKGYFMDAIMIMAMVGVMIHV